MKKWREEDKKMQEMEEKVEEEIRMLKKERNRERAHQQRREPAAKRQKMANGTPMEAEKNKMHWIIPDMEKRKTRTDEEKIPELQGAKKLKRDDMWMINVGSSGVTLSFSKL